MAALAGGALAGAVLLAVAWWIWPGRDTGMAPAPEGPISETDRRLAFDGVRRNAEWRPILRRIGRLDMALVPSGCFRMGSTDAELAVALDSCEKFYGEAGCQVDFAGAEQPVRQVCFDHPFWIGRTEITNREYGSSSSTDMVAMYRGSNWPRETVTWQEANDFCLSHGLRLPSEAEWEFAARGPDGLIFPWGNDFDLERVVSGRLSPENVGLHWDVTSWVGTYDMSGGIAEWAADWYGPYARESALNPVGAAEGDQRVVRGGSWFSFAAFLLRAAHRQAFDPGYASSVVGFRCAGDFES